MLQCADLGATARGSHGTPEQLFNALTIFWISCSICVVTIISAIFHGPVIMLAGLGVLGFLTGLGWVPATADSLASLFGFIGSNPGKCTFVDTAANPMPTFAETREPDEAVNPIAVAVAVPVASD